MVTGGKVCCGCNVMKSYEEYGRDRHRPDGLTTRCKPCRNLATRRYRAQHPERIAAYRERTREEQRARVNDWYQRNRERHLLRTDANRRANRERCNELERARAAANPGK